MQAEASDRCPRCGGAFHCGAGDAAPCACATIELAPGLQQRLRERFAGCLCLHCLSELSSAAEPDPPARIADRVRVRNVKLLSNHWYTLKTTTFDWLRHDGRWQTMHRETYDRGNGAAILLYCAAQRTVVLTRQFRYPAFVNGQSDLMVEVPAGVLDGASPEDCIRAEAEQEAGFRVRAPREVFRAYMSPGAVTERLHFFVAEYDAGDRIGSGGGLETEGEDIEVFESPFDDAMAMLKSGEIVDAKTIMLLQYAALHLFD